jgi:uncharacterized protein YbjT (DUF2867 family)
MPGGPARGKLVVMKIGVIGATSLIGAKLAERLRNEGHQALSDEGAAVVVDVTNAPRDPPGADVEHLVLLSLADADPLAEQAVRTGLTPYTIVRVAQVFEHLEGIADAHTRGSTVRLPDALVQPAAAADVAATLADVAVGAPLNDTVELAGPEVFLLADLIRRLLEAGGDPRDVTIGAELDEQSLLPGDDARIASTTFAEWLRR